MIRPLYFAYGSNMLKERIQQRVGPVEIVGTYKLNGFKLTFDCGHYTAYANIQPSAQDCVEGVLYRLTEQQIAELDYYEGYPKNYEKFYKIDGNNIIYGYWSRSSYFKAHKDAKPALDYINILLDGCRQNKLKMTYSKLWLFKNQNYNLKKGSKHKAYEEDPSNT